MKRALSVVCGAAILAILGFGAWGQDRAEDVTAIVVPIATRETDAFVKAFNQRKVNEIGSHFTSDGDLAFLQGANIEKLNSGLVRGREDVTRDFETFFMLCPNARLTETVRYARLIRPDLLIADVDFEIKGLGDDQGPIEGRAVVIRVLEAGVWKIAAERSFSKTSMPK
ncbi:MAG: hypothetical protein P4L84_32570 [Isosphaeraceae bacterium]|nr:hypothetical protein [Isosphaeraceae bacterium]